MRNKIVWIPILAAIAFGVICEGILEQSVQSQQRAGLTAEVIAQRNSVENELQTVAIVERKLMIPMRDGKRMATDVYRPKDTSKKYPAIFVRTPYNFNFWDVRSGVPRDMTTELNAVKRGYVYVGMNERGHFFSEGNYDILGPPLSDGDDAFTWMAKQPWSNGKVARSDARRLPVSRGWSGRRERPLKGGQTAIHFSMIHKVSNSGPEGAGRRLRSPRSGVPRANRGTPSAQ